MRNVFRRQVRLARSLGSAYRKCWIAVPASLLAAVVSTMAAALVVAALSPLFASLVRPKMAIAMDGVIGPLLAYGVYLTVYYGALYWSERKSLRAPTGLVDPIKLASWWSAVRFDYCAHCPSDVYLLIGASALQISLELSGLSAFRSVLISQGVDDVLTCLKEPAIWACAKAWAGWRNR